jgi:polyhydroxyalkanoate synthase subunit PhaC
MNDQRPPYRVIEHTVVEQEVDGYSRRFVKEIVHIDGNAPLAMVRKRIVSSPKGPPRPYKTLLLLHGFGQNRRAWHLSKRSFSNHLATLGWDVFSLDFRGHGRSRDRGSLVSLDLDGYIQWDAPEALRVALDLSGDQKAVLVGHSLGGMVAYAVAPVQTQHVGGVVTLGAPYVFGRGNRVLWTVVRGVMAATRMLPMGAKVPMSVVQGIFVKARSFWDHPRVPIPVRAWHPESFEREMLEEYLRVAFDRATLGELLHITASGERDGFTSRDGREDYAARWEASHVPALIVAGTNDLLAPPSSVRPAFERGMSSVRSWKTVPLGHADLLVGRDAPEYTWPLVTGWLDGLCRELAR